MYKVTYFRMKTKEGQNAGYGKALFSVDEERMQEHS